MKNNMGKISGAIKSINKYNPLNPNSNASPSKVVTTAGGLVKDVAGAIGSGFKKRQMLNKLIKKTTDKQYDSEGWAQRNNSGVFKVPEIAEDGENLTVKKIRDKMVEKYKGLK